MTKLDPSPSDRRTMWAVLLVAVAILVALGLVVVSSWHDYDLQPDKPRDTAISQEHLVATYSNASPRASPNRNQARLDVSPPVQGTDEEPEAAPTPASLDTITIKLDVTLPPGRKPNGNIRFVWSDPSVMIEEVYLPLEVAIRDGVEIERPSLPNQLEISHDYRPGMANYPRKLGSDGRFQEHTDHDEVLPPHDEQLYLLGNQYTRYFVAVPADASDDFKVDLKFLSSWYEIEFFNIPGEIARVYSAESRDRRSRGSGMIVRSDYEEPTVRDVWFYDEEWYHTQLDLEKVVPTELGFPETSPYHDSVERGPNGKWYVRDPAITWDAQPHVIELKDGSVYVSDGGIFDPKAQVLRVSNYPYSARQSLRFFLACGEIDEEELEQMHVTWQLAAFVFVRSHPSEDGTVEVKLPDDPETPTREVVMPEGYASRVRVEWEAILHVDLRRREAVVAIPDGILVKGFKIRSKEMPASETGRDRRGVVMPWRHVTVEQMATETTPGVLRIE